MNLLKSIQHLPQDQQRRVLLKAQGDMYRESLYLTCSKLCDYKDVNWLTHGPMIDILESPVQNKLIVMPRGSLKSSIGVIAYAIWRVIKDPNIRILIDSELLTNSRTFLTEIKAHMMSEKFIRLFGNPRLTQYGTKTKWTETEIVVAQRTVKRKESTITCAGVGTTKVGQHYDLIIADDYNSPKNSLTPEGRQKVIAHYQMNTSILEPGGETVLIGTRYAADDVIGWVIQNEIGQDAAIEMGLGEFLSVG